MGLFGIGKKKEGTQGGCCGGKRTPETMKGAGTFRNEASEVKVLGSGCTKCNQLETAAKAALEQLGMDATVEHVTDFTQIAAYGVMTTPALVIDGQVVSYGKILKKEEVIAILKEIRG